MTDAWLHDISIGQPELNSSGKFFERRHQMHEKEHIDALKEKQAQSDLGLQNNIIAQVPDKTAIKRSNTDEENQATTKSMAVTSKANLKSRNNKENIAMNNKAIVGKEKENEKRPVLNRKPAQVAAKSVKPLPVYKQTNKAAFVMLPNEDDAMKTGVENKENLNKETGLRKTKSVNELTKKIVRPGLEKQKTVDKPSSVQPAKPQLKRPLQGESKLYNYAEIQKKKKEQLAKRLEEEEKNKMKTDFHARPAPKFKPIPIQIKPKATTSSQLGAGAGKKMLKTNSEPQLNVTNKVKSRENLSRVPSILNPDRLRKTNEHLQKLLEKYEPIPVKFKAQNCKVIYKQPFVPKMNETKPVDAKPFHLQLNNRVNQRREFDRKLHETIEVRKRQEDIRRKQQENDDIKEIRKKMEFKANPIRFYRQ